MKNGGGNCRGKLSRESSGEEIREVEEKTDWKIPTPSLELPFSRHFPGQTIIQS